MLFNPGNIVATSGALKLAQHGIDLSAYLLRHLSGDWGDLCPGDAEENELSLREGFRLLSAYSDRNGTTFWIITEADRSVTTVLLPEDY